MILGAPPRTAIFGVWEDAVFFPVTTVQYGTEIHCAMCMSTCYNLLFAAILSVY